MTTRRWMAGLALAGIALLPACSSSSGSSDAAGPATTSAAATTAPASPAASAAATGTPAARVCAFLDQQQPQVAQAKDANDAKTVLTINLATFASQNPDLRSAVSSEFDKLTTEGCAATRSTILAKLGATSFSSALNLS